MWIATHRCDPVCAAFSCVQTLVWLPMFGIFNVSTDVNRLNAYNKHRGCTNTVRESELKADCSQKISPVPERWTCISSTLDLRPNQLLPTSHHLLKALNVDKTWSVKTTYLAAYWYFLKYLSGRVLKVYVLQEGGGGGGLSPMATPLPPSPGWNTVICAKHNKLLAKLVTAEIIISQTSISLKLEMRILPLL